MQRKLRDSNRAALGCLWISGNRPLPVAKNHRDFATEPNR